MHKFDEVDEQRGIEKELCAFGVQLKNSEKKKI